MNPHSDVHWAYLPGSRRALSVENHQIEQVALSDGHATEQVYEARFDRPSTAAAQNDISRTRQDAATQVRHTLAVRPRYDHDRRKYTP